MVDSTFPCRVYKFDSARLVGEGDRRRPTVEAWVEQILQRSGYFNYGKGAPAIGPRGGVAEGNLIILQIDGTPQYVMLAAGSIEAADDPGYAKRVPVLEDSVHRLQWDDRVRRFRGQGVNIVANSNQLRDALGQAMQQQIIAHIG
jgi:hypothetical protein